jgi:uncharacterized membrane protein
LSSNAEASVSAVNTVGFLWTRQHGMEHLGTLAGDVASGTVTINDGGEIVGIDPAGNGRVVYWHNGIAVDLNCYRSRF